jgi:hypothetical protein
MNHHTLLLTTCATAALCGAVAGAGTVGVEYLGSFGPAVTFRMNDAGQIAGDYQLNSVTTAMRYTPGVGIEARSVPAGAGMSGAYGINNAGACIGQLDPSPTEPEAAAIWSAGDKITVLPPPVGDWTYNTGTGINDGETTCGFVTQAVVGDDPVSAWRWDSANGYTMLPQLNGDYAWARDINASGVICGTAAASESAPARAVIWDASNQIHDLGLVGTATQTFAEALNDAGVVVGSTNNGIPWKYVPDTGMVALPKLAATQPASAHGVNNSGWVVGYSWSAGEPHTVVWDPDGNIYNIADYVGSDFYFPSDASIPIAINDNNVLVVRAYDFSVSGDPRAVRFHFGFPAACPGDIVASGASAGVVDIDDLLAVISAWGPCPAPPAACPPNIVIIGASATVVDIDDLLAVISAWGRCP